MTAVPGLRRQRALWSLDSIKHGRLSPGEAANIGLLDELFQMEQWGEDEITQERHAAIRQEINESAVFSNFSLDQEKFYRRPVEYEVETR